MITGSPGGSRIIGMVLLATLDFMAGKNAQQIAAEPRFHHQFSPDVVFYEANALTDRERAELESRGHKLRESQPYGNLQTVIWDQRKGTVEASSDPRGDGRGLVY
jgi:gamma-glutamyltranspeptidase/glutathione hydrolase